MAAQLLTAFENAIELRSREYGLSVTKSNTRAIQFYRKAGFEVESQSRDSLNLRKSLLPPLGPGGGRGSVADKATTDGTS